MASLSPKNRKDITRRAGELRAATQRDAKHARARWTVEQWLLQLLQDESPTAPAPAVVLSVTRRRCRVRLLGEDIECQLTGTLAERQQTALAPGDEVRIEVYGDGHRVAEVLPRRTSLTRKDPHFQLRQRTIVANVDLVGVVVSVVGPPLHPRLIDRYLAAIHRGGAKAVIVVNKIDLHETPEDLAADMQLIRHFPEIGVPIFPVSTENGTGIEALREHVTDRTIAFVGHSGVGKSSLLRALVPSSEAVVGSVSDFTGKGRHTTTSSELVEAEGFRIIDTPGVREFAVDFTTPQDVLECFPELSVGCRFSDCMHCGEPGCGVPDAVRDGRIPRPRYAVYRRLLAEVGGEAEEEDPDSPRPTFTCRSCGMTVPTLGGGTQHRNHCSFCLHSVHLDIEPGDRSAACGGVMEPISVWVRKGGEWAIVHRCRQCGQLSSNRIAADDNETLLLSMAVRPLGQPPFPLDRVGMDLKN